MKALRAFALVLLVFLLLAAGFVTAVFLLPAVPTSLTNLVIRMSGEHSGHVDHLDLDWNGLHLRELDLTQRDGAAVRLQSLDLRLRFLPLLEKELRIDQLHANTLSVDLRQQASSAPSDDSGLDLDGFDGLLRPLRESGWRLWLDDLRADGEFRLAGEHGGSFEIAGGGVAPARTGEIHSTVVFVPGGPDEQPLEELRETITIQLSQDDTGPRSLKLLGKTWLHAREQVPEEPIIKELVLEQTGTGENYSIRLLSAADREALAVNASFTYGQESIRFDYAAGIDASTLSAWQLAGTIPGFTLSGEGNGEFNLKALSGSTRGDLSGSFTPPVADDQPSQPTVGFQLRFAGKSDGETAELDTFHWQLELDGEPAARLTIPQPFAFALANPAGSMPAETVLAAVELSVPLAPLTPALSRGRIDGRLALTKDADGSFRFESSPHLQLHGLALARPDRPPLGSLDLDLPLRFRFHNGEATLAIDPLHAAFREQPVLEGRILTSARVNPEAATRLISDATLDSDLKLDLEQLWSVLVPPEQDPGNQGIAELRLRSAMPRLGGPAEAQLVLRLSGAHSPDTQQPVDYLDTTLLARLGADKVLSADGSLSMAGPSGMSGLTLSLQLDPPAREESPFRFDARLVGETLYGNDLLLLAKAFLPAETPDAPEQVPDAPAPSSPAPVVDRSPDTEPAWAGFTGHLLLEIEQLTLIEQAFTELKAQLQVDEQRVELNDFSANFAAEPMSAAFSLDFTPDPAAPYRLQSRFELRNLDLASLDREFRGSSQSRLIEGIFNLQGQFNGTGPNLPTLPLWIEGGFDLQATEASYFPMGQFQQGDVASQVLGQVGGLLAGILRGQDQAGYATALEEVLSLLQGVRADELTVVTTLREGLDISVDRFELLSEQLSFTGSGRLPLQIGAPLSEQALFLDLQIGARGNAAQAFNALRLLEGPQNALGYYPGPRFRNAGPIGNASSTLSDILRDSARTYLTRDPIPLPRHPEENPPAEPENPLDALLRLLQPPETQRR